MTFPVAAGEDAEPAGRWIALGALAIALLLTMTTWFSASAVIPQLRVEWGLSSTAAAWLTIAVQLGFVTGALLAALFNVADLVPPRRLMLAGAAGAAAANGLLLLSTSGGTAIPLRFLGGTCLACVYPPALKSMATWFRRGRGTALGIMVGALTLGSAVPHLLNGLGGVDWRLVIVVTSMLTLVGGLAAEFLGTDGPFPFSRAVFDPRQAGVVFSQRPVRLASLGYFGHMWELYAMWTWVVLFFEDTLVLHGVSAAGRFAAFSAFGAIGIGALGCWVGGVLGDRWGRTRLTALAMVLSGTCAVLIGLVRGGPLALVIAVGLVWGFWVVADSAQFSAIVTEVADQRYVGTALTLQLAVGFTLTVLTIWLIPILREHLTWTWAFAFLAPGPLIGTVAMLRLLHSPDSARIAGGRG